MDLNEDDIYNSLESYRNKMGYSQEKMAELVGLATKQTYANMIKNKTMKFSYFINLINNTGLSSDYFLNLTPRKEQQEQKIYKEVEVIKDFIEENYERKCPVCATKDKLILSYEKQIELLEFQLGKNRKNG